MRLVLFLWLVPLISCSALELSEEILANQVEQDSAEWVTPLEDASTPSMDEAVQSKEVSSEDRGVREIPRHDSRTDPIGLLPSDVPEILLQGANLPGTGVVDIGITGGWVTHILAASQTPASGTEVVDLSGKWVIPAFIDSHVHLTYLPAENAMIDGGIAGAVDLAAPVHSLGKNRVMTILSSGPMITAVGGYPTQSWGANGYGLECSADESVEASIQLLSGLGAKVIKIPLGHGPSLSPSELEVAVNTAHSLELPVAVHALSDSGVLQAGEAGADLLAHTPTESLSDQAIEGWGSKTVISTLSAFGGSAVAVENLSQLRDGGTTILYGTDFGNTTTPGIQSAEIALLLAAGMSGKAIVESGTSAPAQFWGLNHMGSIEVGKEASLLVLDEDPYLNPMTLASPEAVLFKGKWR